MVISELAKTVSLDHAQELKRLWASRFLKPTQDALIALWCQYTNDAPSDFTTGCNKCRARIIGRIGTLIQEIRKHEKHTQHK